MKRLCLVLIAAVCGTGMLPGIGWSWSLKSRTRGRSDLGPKCLDDEQVGLIPD
jgi:hypothetical protein